MAFSVVSKEPLGAERGAEDVSGEVSERGSVAAGVGHVGHPFASEDLRGLLQETGVKFGVAGLQGDLKAVAEAGSRRLVMSRRPMVAGQEGIMLRCVANVLPYAA